MPHFLHIIPIFNNSMLDRVAEFIASDQCKSVVFLTGAGMSVGAAAVKCAAFEREKELCRTGTGCGSSKRRCSR